MHFEYDEKLKITLCYGDKKDKCSTCMNYEVCPLISSIETHLVYPAYGKIYIKECPMYEFADYHKTENL